MEQVKTNALQRINVIGTSGCGKSTFSRELATLLKAPYIEIDKIFWGPDWSFAEDEIFFKKLEAQLNQAQWILDGNYTRTTPIKWKNVEMVIWLDYPLWLVMARIIKRTLSRALNSKELWEGTGNRETFRKVFSRDSMILWSWNTYNDNRAKYNEAMHNPAYAHIKFIRLSNPLEADLFLKGVDQIKKER